MQIASAKVNNTHNTPEFCHTQKSNTIINLLRPCSVRLQVHTDATITKA